MIDRATIVGIAATLTLIGWACYGAANALDAFWQTSSVALVVGGAALTTLISAPGMRLRSIGQLLKRAMTVRTRTPEELVATLVGLAHAARRDGLLALEKPVELLEDDFLKRAMRMAVDGADARTIEQVCRTELECTDLRHACGSGLLETMGRVAPVFGMIGTLIGLVVMLGKVDDPSKIGQGMAVALLTTLYGLVVAHVFCLPLARKLTYRSSEELLNKTLALQGVLAIHAGDNPRIVEQKLRAYLPARPVERSAPAALELPVAAPGRRARWMQSLSNVMKLKPLAGIVRHRRRAVERPHTDERGQDARLAEERMPRPPHEPRRAAAGAESAVGAA